jgi:uncharacterized protein (TIGR02246 family)
MNSRTSQQILDLVDRQARAWEQGDFAVAAADWRADGELISPGGKMPASAIGAEISSFHKQYADLSVTVKNVFASPDGGKVAIEWDWEVTRRSDGTRDSTQDAIIVDLVEGKIASWREYFDLGGSVEAPDRPKGGAVCD